MRSRDSFGLAICKKGVNNQVQILLCRHRVSYEFLEFVRGRFIFGDYTKIIKLFDNMTKLEKEIILSNDFEIMTKHANLKINYNICRKKINNAIEYIKTKNINGTKNLIWDLPKGRSEINEKPLDTAMRETEEELQLNLNHYRIISDLLPVMTSYIDYDVVYNFMFYFAQYTSPTDDWIVDNLEVDFAKWFTLEEVKKINSPLNDTIISLLSKYEDYCSKK